MRKIILLGTKHAEDGLLNCNELYNIIEMLDPDVIFEEIPPSFFDLYYKTKERSNLESRTIINYLFNHSIPHIPVDYYDLPKLFFENTRKVHEIVERRSRKYCQLIDTNKYLAAKHGFKYLNSEEYERIEFEINAEIDEIINIVNNNKYSEYWNTWKEIEQERENKMIDNILKYSLDHQYNIGVFIIGAGHRKSIINKIKNYNCNTSNLITWEYNNYDNIW